MAVLGKAEHGKATYRFVVDIPGINGFIKRAIQTNLYDLKDLSGIEN